MRLNAFVGQVRIWRAMLLIAGGVLLSCSPKMTVDRARQILQGLQPGIYAIIVTSQGNIVARLFTDQAPRTTANFIGLAEGVQPWTRMKTLEQVKNQPFYDGLIFHRSDWNTAIQTGDPTAMGFGGPGYTFPEEITPGLNFDQPGMMAMAKDLKGIDNNGSQFFITARPVAEFNAHNSIFGEVVRGLEIVQNMSRLPTYIMARPVRDQKLKMLRIWRIEADGSLIESPPPPKVDIGMKPVVPGQGPSLLATPIMPRGRSEVRPTPDAQRSGR
jgi:peptidyl-prolyl cis-trans isomerase A (cyclophilin A)